MAGRSDLTTRRFKALRLRVLARDNYTCLACGATPADFGGNPSRMTADHIIPPSVTGIPGDEYPDHMMQTLCLPCNSSKGNRINARLSYQNPKYK